MRSRTVAILRVFPRAALWDTSIMTQRRSWILLGALALMAAIVGAWVARELDSSGVALARGTWLPQARTVSALSLTDHTGKPFSEQDLRGKPSLVFFGFT